MSNDLESLYTKYRDFVTCLRADLDRVVGQRVAPRYCASLLEYDDFCQTWDRWGRTDGLQAVWRQRFEQGYHQTVASLRARLEAAILESNCADSAPSPRAAA